MKTTLQTIDLHSAAREAMVKNGFQPDFPAAVQEQLSHLGDKSPVHEAAASGIRDLREKLWSSIDNDTSRDLDQIEVVEQTPNGAKVLIGIADVDFLVSKSSPIDDHAAVQTTSVYTGIQMFPMLPEQLSTGATSLLEGQDRLCIVVEFVVSSDGNIGSPDCYQALVRNRAQLTYKAVGAWLEGKLELSDKIKGVPGLQEQLKLQDSVAQALRRERFQQGALNLASVETEPLIVDGQVVGLVGREPNPATELIEDFMVAANESVAKILENAKVSSIRRIVRTPERWNRIVELAAAHGEVLPTQPDSAALNTFLTKMKSVDTDHFADLSLAVVKLMGPGEYVLQRLGDPEEGHFGLAVQDYSHSTAPNRRFADLVTQRLIKAVLAKARSPYTDEELAHAAKQCTEREDAARKVEREMNKRIAAVGMQNRIGETFDGIVTGKTTHGTFVRVPQAHCEGLVTRGEEGLDVGDKIKVSLVSVDVSRGYIDFARQ